MELDTTLMYTLGLLVIFGLAIWLRLSQLDIKALKMTYETDLKNSDIYTSLTIDETIKEKEFFDNFLITKFEYYLTTHILAYFASDKDIEIKEIKSLKEQYYADVSKTLNNHQKARLLMIFTATGTELYVHQTFLRLLNDANIKFKQNNLTGMDALNQQTLNTIYKG